LALSNPKERISGVEECTESNFTVR